MARSNPKLHPKRSASVTVATGVKRIKEISNRISKSKRQQPRPDRTKATIRNTKLKPPLHYHRTAEELHAVPAKCFPRLTSLPPELQYLIWESAMANTEDFVEATYCRFTNSFLSFSSRSFIAAHIPIAHLEEQYVSVHFTSIISPKRFGSRPTVAPRKIAQEKCIYIRPTDTLYIPEISYMDVSTFVQRPQHHKIRQIAIPMSNVFRLGSINKESDEFLLLSSLKGLECINVFDGQYLGEEGILDLEKPLKTFVRGRSKTLPPRTDD
ncbi:hypothetical protein EG329_002008 [Mollisiaceae sp. DMI_Dod_QoI]|nr:hypothetical protein EG329_002008 [Helotiales sp. DMI_Dod_QoI]